MKKIITILLLIVLIQIPISAHPGNTDDSGCHTCYTNCEEWGLEYGEYHCHNGNSSSGTSSLSQ